ncbi:MAG: endolytic transglycosylase MltG [Acetatifactor sp.]|nr:endolytic transglycosylase MltG [Acetatifactor sp.]
MKPVNIIISVVGAICRVAIIILAVYVIYQGALKCYDYGYRIFTEPAISSGEGKTVTVAITGDMSASDIGHLLENKGLIRDANLFILQYYLSEYREDVKPGIFELSTSMTAEEMMEVMTLADEDDAAGQDDEE